MKASLILLCLFASFGQVLAQGNVQKPRFGDVMMDEGPAPGTMQVKVSVLEVLSEKVPCIPENQAVTVTIKEVMSAGSSLVYPVQSGDTVRVWFPQELPQLSENEQLTPVFELKEQPCDNRGSIWQLIRKM